MNLLIICAEFSEQFPLPADLIQYCIDLLPKNHSDEYSNGPRLTYFEIISILYYIDNNALYSAQRVELLKVAKDAIADLNPCEYAETAYLLLDLVASPILTKTEKDSFVQAAMKHGTPSPAVNDIGAFRNRVLSQTWYFNWNRRDSDLQTHLKKKRLLLAY